MRGKKWQSEGMAKNSQRPFKGSQPQHNTKWNNKDRKQFNSNKPRNIPQSNYLSSNHGREGGREGGTLRERRKKRERERNGKR